MANAYRLAGTGTLLLTSLLYLPLTQAVWRWPMWRTAPFGVVTLGAEVVFFAANLTKLLSGGWLPLLIAVVIVTVMTTWRDGHAALQERRSQSRGRWPTSSTTSGGRDHPRARRPSRAPPELHDHSPGPCGRMSPSTVHSTST